MPYFNLLCYHLGFSGFEIGVLSSVQTAAVLIFPVLWAIAADRFNSRKPIFILCTFMSAILWSLLFFTKEFFPVLFILAVYSVFYSPIIAFLEAFAMDILGKEKKKYGKSRAWGTISFIVVSLILGKILLVYPTDIIIPLILLGMAIQSFLALKMPGNTKIPSRSEQANTEGDNAIKDSTSIPSLKAVQTKQRLTDNSGSKFKAFFSLRTSLFLFAAFLMLVSHGAYYGFFSIYLESLGFSTGFIGFAWALASIAEIAVMMNSDRIFSRFNLKTVMIISFGASCLRWLMLFATSGSINTQLLSTTSAAVILLSQLLHAFTYGSFHIASILAVDKLSPKGTTFGQAVNNAITYGAGMMTGFLLSGIFYDRLHGYLFFASAVVALAGGIIILYVRFDDSGDSIDSCEQ